MCSLEWKGNPLPIGTVPGPSGSKHSSPYQALLSQADDVSPRQPFQALPVQAQTHVSPYPIPKAPPTQAAGAGLHHAQHRSFQQVCKHIHSFRICKLSYTVLRLEIC